MYCYYYYVVYGYMTYKVYQYSWIFSGCYGVCKGLKSAFDWTRQPKEELKPDDNWHIV